MAREFDLVPTWNSYITQTNILQVRGWPGRSAALKMKHWANSCAHLQLCWTVLFGVSHAQKCVYALDCSTANLCCDLGAAL